MLSRYFRRVADDQIELPVALQDFRSHRSAHRRLHHGIHVARNSSP